MCNALTVTKRESAPLPERLCERIAYCAILLTVYEADYSVVVAQSEGADHRYYSTPEMQNILLQNAVGHAVRKAKNFAGGATDTILSGRQVLINLMSDFVLDKTKATAESRQWKSYILERITNNATFAAGGQCDQSDLVRSKVCNESFFLCSLRNFSRANEQGANLSCSCSLTAFLRCFFLDEDNFFNDLSVIVYTCNPVRHSSSLHGASDGYSCSLALRRWRRLISPSNAAVTNCPVLSPSSLTLSMASTIWSGTRASILFDFAFTDFVAISDFRLVWCPTMIARKKFNAMLDVSHTDKITCVRHLIFISHKMTKPRTVGAVTGLLTTNDSESIEVAMRNHTTHPQGRDSHNLNKYIWRFIALSTAQPRVIHIEATSEQEARQQSPDGCVMVFAARIRQEVEHV
ncbi:host cell division inhibitor Icd-like protein [Escherichia coli]|nr:host cell division inhibitor Icd-like protein [Escherichia coli]EEW2431356.1 host cell division inhibitor Icd-like protein [Escherichia coli]EFB5737493.1 host cell division inhibitor Icd-like protein [Escherichia coli]EFH4831531.1 host cell division inhibitor Icd-like protein [Escherichia coli]EFH5989558.1 host cell division inhibitor Icd-like protein [Escherichia coli]